MIAKRTKRAGRAAALIVAGAVTLAGCGQKGPLYLPTAQQASPAPHNTNNQDKTLRKNTQ